MSTLAKKVLAVLVMALLVVAVFNTYAFAIDAEGIAGQLTGTATPASDSVTNVGNQIIGIITTVGVVVAVIVLLVLGIKYMMGSASEKAEYKKTMIPYIVGAVLIFAGTSLVRVIYSLSTSVSTK